MLTKEQFEEKLKDPEMSMQINFAFDVAYHHIGMKAVKEDLIKCHRQDVVEMIEFALNNKISCCGWIFKEDKKLNHV